MSKIGLKSVTDSFRTKKWPWLVSVLVVMLLAGSLLFKIGFASPGADPAAAEQTASPSSSAGAEPTVTTEPERQDKKEEGQSMDSRVKPQVDVEKSLPASQQNGPERAGAEAPPAVKPQPQIPPKPVGIVGVGTGLRIGVSMPAGSYIFFGKPGLEVIYTSNPSSSPIRLTTIDENGRSPVATVSNGQTVYFGNMVAYTPEQVAILDQYYGGVG